ncbi:hypothetical protein F5Y17DRAFT_268164 [Xylariaceae sp. FL0594]|nr:hypothetical protein F5Y17DRAFT_268164 [Xylariaceae sp. FL0594]
MSANRLNLQPTWILYPFEGLTWTSPLPLSQAAKAPDPQVCHLLVSCTKFPSQTKNPSRGTNRPRAISRALCSAYSYLHVLHPTSTFGRYLPTCLAPSVVPPLPQVSRRCYFLPIPHCSASCDRIGYSCLPGLPAHLLAKPLRRTRPALQQQSSLQARLPQINLPLPYPVLPSRPLPDHGRLHLGKGSPLVGTSHPRGLRQTKGSLSDKEPSRSRISHSSRHPQI